MLNRQTVEAGRKISDLDRAAILLLTMGEENAGGIIKRLTRHEVGEISRRMAKIANVSQEDIAIILKDFFECYRNESGVNGASRLYLERALDKAVGRKLARGMLDDIYGGAMADDIRKLEWVQPELLARFLEQEHVQMQALLLAFLPADQSSAVLAQFPREKHDDILYRIASLREVSEHVMEDLRHMLESCIDFVGEQVGARVDGVEKVAEIINRYEGDRADVMELLKMHNEETADAIQDKMYDFSTLARQRDDVLAQLLNEIPDDVWTLAMKGTDAGTVHKILSVLPARLAQVYRQQIENMKAQPVSKVEAARAEVMAIIRQMMNRGEIDYRLYDEATLG